MKTRLIRQFEKEVHTWPGVQKDHRTFHMLSYLANRRTFAYIEGDDLMLLRVSPGDKKTLYEEFGGHPYTLGGIEYRLDTTVPLTEDVLAQIWPIIKRSYEHTLTWKGA